MSGFCSVKVAPPHLIYSRKGRIAREGMGLSLAAETGHLVE